jgi:ribonuclease inhibitor
MPVEPKRCTIAGRHVLSLELFYDEIARQLDFPAYFGRNLDALYDVLSTDLEGPLEMIWEDASVSQTGMGKDFLRLREVLEQVASERDDFVIVFA